MDIQKYFIVGMPSSGKSTIGKLLSRQLFTEFIDLDELIVQHEGISITDIFQKKGESYFRELERQILMEQLSRNGSGYVLATGGGTPCFFDNMDLMNQHGVTIFINVPIEDLFQKLQKKGTQKSPLLQNKSSEELLLELQSKFDERKKYYAESQIILKQTFIDISERVNQVLFAIKMLKK